MWEKIPLPEVLDFREGPGIMARDFRDEGVPLIRLAGLKGRSVLEGCNFLAEADVKRRWSQFRTRLGDTLLSTSASLGEVAVVDSAGVGAVPYTGIITFRPKDERVAPGFIPLMLREQSFKDQIEAMGVGSVMKHFGPTHLKHMNVTVPPRREQHAITEVLGALDDKIAANAAVAYAADAYASTVLLGSLSPNRVRLDSIAHITMGSSPRGETLNELSIGVPFYQGVRDYGFRSPTRRVFTTSPVRSADADDILVSVRAPVGDVNVADEPLCIGRGLAAVRSTIGAQATLFHQLKAERDAWEPFEAEGTVFGSINRDQLHAVQVRPVRPERVSRIEHELASLESLIAAALSENRTLAATRDALLPQLMSGKLRVRDAGAIAAEAGA